MTWLRKQVERVPLSIRRDAGFVVFVWAVCLVAGYVVYRCL